MEVKLLSPSWEHREQCIELLKEWKESGEEIHPGTLRRCPCTQNPILSQSKWLEWLAAEKQQGQNLFFLIRGTEDCWELSVSDHRSRERVFGLMGTAVMESAHRSAERVMQPGCSGWR